VLYALPPDPQATLITFLSTHTDVAAISGMRVSSTKLDGPAPRIQVTALPAENTQPFEEAAEFQVDCWGGTETQALTLARTVCAAIYELTLQSASVTAAYPTVRPFAAHDPETGRPRFITQLQIVQS
jgi:hypothetical protein